MTACVFLGPTLPVTQARQVLSAEYLPPVRQGDVYRAVRRYRPRVIGIVDGYFHQVPSVWHKEILWAMAEGVHVFGSASMGALRAAELQRFGMHGVGEVFASYSRQTIEDDDEVAVVHGPPETGFIAASEAMVNIRKTLANAEDAGVVSEASRRKLVDIAKSLFYPRRSYAELLQCGADSGLEAGELSALRDWLERGRVDVKREDAIKMLAAMGEMLADDMPPKQVEYSFEHTTLWEAAIREIDAPSRGAAVGGEHSEQEWLLDELRLSADPYQSLKQAALLRLLARREAEREGMEVSDEELKQFTTDFRLRHGLHFARDLDRWLSDRSLDRRSFQRLMQEELLLSRLAVEKHAELRRCLVDQLRFEGGYEQIAARVRAKRKALEAAGESEANGATKNEADNIDNLRAMKWYFTQYLGRPMPEDLDTWAVRAGFESARAFRRAVVREYRFQLQAKEA